MWWIVGFALLFSLIMSGIAFFTFYKVSREKIELNKQSLKIREEILEKELKIQNLAKKEREIFTNLEETKERKIKEMNDSLIVKSGEIQSQLNEMRLKQESEIQKELQEKKAKSLKLYLEELDKSKAELTASHQEDIRKIKEELENLRSLEGAARMARERDLKELDEKTWHMITFTKEDLEELDELNSIKLRNPLPLKKAIYDIYYREPVRSLLNRVLGKNKISGIYKITLLKTGQIYIGKSVDIHRRWTEHIKRGMGAEKPTNSILYDVLKEHGVQSFTFEVIEEVDAAKLTEKESYWIDYFGSKIFGFNMRG